RRRVIDRGLLDATDLAHILQRRVADLRFGRRWLEIMKDTDIAAHGGSLTGGVGGRSRISRGGRGAGALRRDYWAASSRTERRKPRPIMPRNSPDILSA